MRKSIATLLSFVFCVCMIFCFTACGEEKIAHEHTLSEIAEVPATCTSAGTAAITKCLNCDYQIGGEVIEALGHSLQKISGQASTCTNEGFTDYERCTACKLEQSKEVLPLAEHSLTTIPAKSATCTDNGHTEIKECSVCGYKLGDEIIEALGHTFEDIAEKKPTCLDAGHSAYQKCSVCGFEDGKQTISAMGHDLHSVPSKTATCSEAGHSSYKQCSRCDYIVGKEDVPATPHSFIVTVIGLPATCNREGRTMTEQCTVCGYITGGETIAKKDHTWKITPQVEPSCTRDGTTAIKTCSFCKLQEGGGRIKPTGHSYITIPEKQPTPEEPGHSSYKQCTRCSVSTGKIEIIYVCKEHSFEIIPEKAATPTKSGHTQYEKCTVCNYCQGLQKTIYQYSFLSLLPSAYDKLALLNLSEDEKKEIIGMYNSAIMYEPSYTPVYFKGRNSVNKLCYVLWDSFPELFHMRTALSNASGTSVSFNYQIPQDKYLDMMATIEKTIPPIISAVKNLKDIHKVKYFYDYLIANCTYVSTAPYKGTAYGALVDKAAVCEGFAEAFDLLCSAAGLKCTSVVGFVSTGGDHQWNIVEIDGKCYYFDATWDNYDTLSGNFYKMFGISSEYLATIGHSLRQPYPDIVPDCPNTLEMPGRYYPLISDEQDVCEELSKIAQYAIKYTPNYICILCETDEDYEEVKKNFMNYLYYTIRQEYPRVYMKYNYFPSTNTVFFSISY